MKILVLSLISTFVFYFSTYGQVKIEEPIFRHESQKPLSRFLADRFAVELRKQIPQELCISSVTFVKFTLDEEGKIDNVSFTKGSPKKIKEALEPIIISMNGYWTPRRLNGKAIKSEPFILPFIYNYESRCTSDYSERYSAAVGTLMQALDNILQFDDGSSIENTPCIILPPLRSSSMR